MQEGILKILCIEMVKMNQILYVHHKTTIEIKAEICM